MKSYTDIEQSKKLVEILPIESADGFYEAQHNPVTDDWEYILFVGNEWASPEAVIPCWSLAALLDYLAKKRCFPDMIYTGAHYLVEYYVYKLDTLSTEAYELIDACVEMIYKLKEMDSLL